LRHSGRIRVRVVAVLAVVRIGAFTTAATLRGERRAVGDDHDLPLQQYGSTTSATSAAVVGLRGAEAASSSGGDGGARSYD
jgi:hypothetical protein